MRKLIEFQFDEPIHEAAYAIRRFIADSRPSGFAVAAPGTVLREMQISQEWQEAVAPLIRDGCVESLRAIAVAGDFPAGPTNAQHGSAGSRAGELVGAAQHLGATRLTIEPASVRGLSAVRYQDGLNQTYTAVRELIPELERSGVRLCLRAAVNGFLMSPPEMRELLDAFDSAFVGADVDMLHARCDRASAEDWLATLGPRVFIVGVPEDSQADADTSWPRAFDDLSNACIVVRNYNLPGA